MPGSNPGEGYSATNLQLFGATRTASGRCGQHGFLTNYAATLALNKQRHRPIVPGTVPADIMGIFTPEMLPVLSGLARGYAVCDRWYCSVPTETIPNRAFAAAATSQGHMNDLTKSFAVPTIYGLLTASGVRWKIYGYDQEPLTRLDFTDAASAPDADFRLFADFQADAAAGRLPGMPSWSQARAQPEQPASRLRRRQGRAARPRRLPRSARSARVEPDAAHRYLRRAWRMPRPRSAARQRHFSRSCVGLARFALPAYVSASRLPGLTAHRRRHSIPSDGRVHSARPRLDPRDGTDAVGADQPDGA